MNGDSSEGGAVQSSQIFLALACVVVWVTAVASTGALGIWRALGGAAIGLGIVVLVLDRRATWELLRPSPRLVLIGAVGGVSMAAATYLLYPVLNRIAPFMRGETALLYSAFRVPSTAVASLALVPIILGEELVWRGEVQTELARRFGPSAGVAVAACAYALAHAPLGSSVLILVALACGASWSALRAATGSLVPTLVAHVVWDAVVLLWLPLDSR